MPDVGSDFISSPVNLPINYAAQDWEIEQNQAHKFDQYTNPFLLAKSFNDVELPLRQQGDQEAQAQAQNILANKQYQLQQTQQATMLPLQAMNLGAQTDYTRALGATAAFGLSQQQLGAAQVPSLGAALSKVAPGDNAGLYGAVAQNPAALATPQGQALFSRATTFGDQQYNVQQSALATANSSEGAALAMQIPSGASAEQWVSDNIKPPQQSDFSTPGAYNQALLAYNAKVGGVYSNFAKAQIMRNHELFTLAARDIASTGRVDAARINQMGALVRNGTLDYAALQGQVGLQAAAAIWPQLGLPVPSSQGQGSQEDGAPQQSNGLPPISDKQAEANTQIAAKWLNDPTASPYEQAWAQDMINNHGRGTYQMPLIDPDYADQIKSGRQAINDLKLTLPNLSKSPTWTGAPSPYEVASQKLQQMYDDQRALEQKATIRPGGFMPMTTAGPVPAGGLTPYGQQNVNTTTPQGPNAPAPPVLNPQTSAGGFYTGFGHDFLGTPDFNSPVLPPNRGAAPSAAVPTGGAPASTAPAQGSATTQAAPAEATMEQLKQVANSIGVKDVRYMTPYDQSQLSYAALNPTAKITPKILFKLKNTYGNRGM